MPKAHRHGDAFCPTPRENLNAIGRTPGDQKSRDLADCGTHGDIMHMMLVRLDAAKADERGYQLRGNADLTAVAVLQRGRCGRGNRGVT